MVVGSLLLSVDAVNGSGDGVKNEVGGGWLWEVLDPGCEVGDVKGDWTGGQLGKEKQLHVKKSLKKSFSPSCMMTTRMDHMDMFSIEWLE